MTSTRKQIECFALISMLYIAFPLCAQILLHKEVSIFSQVISAGSFFSPIWFTFSDVVAEVYGYQVSRKMFFYMLVVDFVFCAIVVIGDHFPSPAGWIGSQGYQLVVGDLLKLFLADLVGFFIGGLINIRLITKWKFMLRGRYFWLRSIGASAVGEIIFTGVAFVIVLYGEVGHQVLVSMIVWGIVLKLVANIILAFPATLLVLFLKRNGYADFLSKEQEFNPFKKSLDQR